MSKNKVVVILNTDLRLDHPELHDFGAIHCLKGNFLEESSNGFHLEITHISSSTLSMKKTSSQLWQKSDSKLKRIFVPAHKIDFIYWE